jgi:antiviral helicase SKI2
MSDQNLELLPDYEQRIDVLKELGFIDENGNVELKGRVACEVPLYQIKLITRSIL